MKYGFKNLFYKVPHNLVHIKKLIKKTNMSNEILKNMENGGLKYIPIFEEDINIILKKILTKIDYSDIGGIIIPQSIPFKFNIPKNIPTTSISGQPCAIMHLGIELAKIWNKDTKKDILIIGVDKPLPINERLFFNSGMGDIILIGILSNKNLKHQILSSHIDSYIFADNGEFSNPNDIKKFRENNPLIIRENIFKNLKKSNLNLKDIKYIFPHTPYLQIWDIMAKVLNFPREKIITDYIGTTAHMNSNDSFYHYLKSIEKGIVKKNDIVLLINNGFGGSRGSTIIRYKGDKNEKK